MIPRSNSKAARNRVKGRLRPALLMLWRDDKLHAAMGSAYQAHGLQTGGYLCKTAARQIAVRNQKSLTDHLRARTGSSV